MGKGRDAQGNEKKTILAVGDHVYRKDELGEAGKTYGQAGHLHLEIALNDKNLSILLGKEPKEWKSPPSEWYAQHDGRTDVIFGNTWIRVPKGAETLVSKTPPDISSGQVRANCQSLEQTLWVELEYKSGDAIIRSYTEDGTLVGTRTEPGGEYNLYKEAQRLHKQRDPKTGNSSPSAWYELLRFGRNLSKDPLPEQHQHWRQVAVSANEVRWVNLSSNIQSGMTKTTAFSDADFPAAAGWRLVDDDWEGAKGQTQRCDSEIIRKLIKDTLSPADQKKADEKTTDGYMMLGKQARTHEALQAKLRRMICKFPTEFDRGNFEQRYGHNAKDDPFASKPELWEKARRHFEALTVTDLPEAYKQAMWHIHPVEFIRLMQRCGWISKATLKRIYTQTPAHLISTYIVALNQVTRKYGFNTPKRLPHFIGQGAVESGQLLIMQEAAQELITQPDGTVKGGSMIADSKKNEAEFGHWWGQLSSERVAWYGATKYNSKGSKIAGSYNWKSDLANLGDPDAQKFRGRGFKQLTGRLNYSKYWVYRGWLSPNSFDANWWDDPAYIAKNEQGMKKRPAEIPDPQKITISPWNCIDSGGWYMVFARPTTIKQMDNAKGDFFILVTDITMAINGGKNGLTERARFTTIAKEILA